MTVVSGFIPEGMPAWKYWIVQVGRVEAEKNTTKFMKWSLSALTQVWMYHVYMTEFGTHALSRRKFLDLCDYLELNWQFLSPQIQKAIPFRSLYNPSAIDWTGPITSVVAEGCQEYFRSVEDTFDTEGNQKGLNESLRRETSA